MSGPDERLLGRLPQQDPRSRNYPVMATLAAHQPRSYTWALPGPVLDQGQPADGRRDLGTCVGHAWAHERLARPKPRPATSRDALAVYDTAQDIDPWEGRWPAYSGTSVLAGAKAAVALGWFTGYRWAFGLDQALVAISRRGPAVLGLPWHVGMMRPDSDGWIKPTGDHIGDHAILAVGVNVRLCWMLLANSWGPGWGRAGYCRISWYHLGELLARGGDACIPEGRLG